MKSKSCLPVWGLVVLLGVVGCGEKRPPLAPVSGTVTLDGDPLPDVSVEFYPEAGGRPGRGVTDADGKYELVFDSGVRGGQVGMNKVTITTMWPDGEPPPGQTDPVLPKYNSKSTLTEEIVKGQNVIDFSLDSK